MFPHNRVQRVSRVSSRPIREHQNPPVNLAYIGLPVSENRLYPSGGHFQYGVCYFGTRPANTGHMGQVSERVNRSYKGTQT